jgi:hypothetical protein
MDVVHIAWCMCPASLSNLCTGKEGYPTLAYNVVVNHEGRAEEAQKSSFGSFNDKTIVHFDDFIADLRTDPFFTDFQFKVLTGSRPDDFEMLSGAYVIVDGGYHQWEATQAASRLCTDPGYAEWRKRMESVRKDVECFFGRLKARFRVLKMPISFHKKKDVDNTFLTCVALHNIIHDWDKEMGNITSWEIDPSWDNGALDEEGADSDARFWARPRLRRAKKKTDFFTPQETDDFSCFGVSSLPIGIERTYGSQVASAPFEKLRYLEKQAKLVAHYNHASESGAMPWLRS